MGQASLGACSRETFARVVPAGTRRKRATSCSRASVDLTPTTGEACSRVVGDFYLTRTTFPPAVVWLREYRERVPLAASTPEALANAWNEALGRVLAALVRDLAETELSVK